MDLFEFIHYNLNPLFEKLANEQKSVFLLRDVNVDLLKYEQHKATNEFLDPLSSNIFLPYLILSNQLELLFTQRLSLIKFFPIATISDHLYYNFSLYLIFFQMFQTGKPIYLNVIGQNLIMKNSF